MPPRVQAWGSSSSSSSKSIQEQACDNNTSYARLPICYINYFPYACCLSIMYAWFMKSLYSTETNMLSAQ